MNPEQIKKMNGWLQGRITLEESSQGIAVQFDEPLPVKPFEKTKSENESKSPSVFE